MPHSGRTKIAATSAGQVAALLELPIRDDHQGRIEAHGIREEQGEHRR